MITKIRDNAPLFSLLGGAILIISAGAVGYYQLSGLVAAQPEIQRHIYDSSRHVNAEVEKKKEEEIEDLKRRVRELEAQRWRQFIDRQREERMQGRREGR